MSVEYDRAWYQRNRETVITRAKAYQIDHRDHILAYNRSYYEVNKEAIKKRAAEYYQKNRLRLIAHVRDYQKKNPGITNARISNRRAKELKATPAWLTKDQLVEIQRIYQQASELGLVVDHIVPLTNKRVCGLHVPWNLQLLTNAENCKKSNLFEP